MLSLYQQVCNCCSKLITEQYSTSFSSAIKRLDKTMHAPIYNIYGFVRFADEIVDTFHEYPKEELLAEFKKETYQAIDRKISLNPILNSFQQTVTAFNIERGLIESFFRSMEMDLNKANYTESEYKEYIYGSAEVVGLMCLHVFCKGDQLQYQLLKPSAQSLGAAFQKINFLRDIQADFLDLNRTYFPDINFKNFKEQDKKEIEKNIQKDFDDALVGIKKLPVEVRYGVYVAYQYYLALFNKIKTLPAVKITNERIRIPTIQKFGVLLKTKWNHQTNNI